jgi:hypothetical protein
LTATTPQTVKKRKTIKKYVRIPSVDRGFTFLNTIPRKIIGIVVEKVKLLPAFT